MNVSLVWDSLVIWGSTSAFLALSLWFFIRKKHLRLWLPTIQVVVERGKIFPQIILTRPPWLSFLFFLLTTLAVWFFMTRPQEIFQRPVSKGRKSAYVFIDLSPSVSAFASPEVLRQKIHDLWLEAHEYLDLVFFHSAQRVLFRPQTIGELDDWLSQVEYHKPGVLLDEALMPELSQFNDAVALIVMTDRDRYSWDKFKWQALDKDIPVWHWDVSEWGNPRKKYNVYIQQARYRSAPQSLFMNWDLAVGANQLEQTHGLKIIAYLDDIELAQQEFEMSPQQPATTVHISWPQNRVLENLARTKRRFLRFKLVPDATDAITLDNEFKTPLFGAQGDVMVIASPQGERFIEDSTYHLQSTLKVLSFQVKRSDFVEQPGPGLDQALLWVVEVPHQSSYLDVCPENFKKISDLIAKSQSNDQQGLTSKPSQVSQQSLTKPLTRIWLAPDNPFASWESMCQCMSMILPFGVRKNGQPVYCQDNKTRARFIELLASLGLSQIGGSMGDPQQALAFRYRHEEAGVDLLVWTLALRPSRLTGLTHARLPRLIRDMLILQGVLDDDSRVQNLVDRWPRYDSVSQLIRQIKDPIELAEQLKNSNVPLGESLLNVKDRQGLPRLFTLPQLKQEKFRALTGSLHTQKDPWPWIKLILTVLYLSMAFEVLSKILVMLVKRYKRSSGVEGRV